MDESGIEKCDSPITSLSLPERWDVEEFDDNSLVLITESDLDGYEENHGLGEAGESEVNLACRVQVVSQAAISTLSYLWVRCQTGQKVSRSMGVDIHVY